MKNHLIVTCIVLWLCACASGSTVVTGPRRSAVGPDEVQLYSSPPGDYEVLGIVKASSQMGWTEQGSMDYAIAELKKQAGKIGANGVLLKNVGEKGGTGYGTYIPNGSGGGVFIAGQDEVQTISGEAIYVKQAKIEPEFISTKPQLPEGDHSAMQDKTIEWRLRQLDELKRKRLISDDEYEKKRAEILTDI